MNNRFPLVTVITPTYNREDLLAETIDSVLSQDYPNFEYIVLDDGSKDNTKAVLAGYDDPRLRWESHDNMGEARTVNKGFSMAKGEYVTVVNSDDPLLPDHLKTSVEFMEAHPDILVGYPDWIMINDDSEKIREFISKDYSYRDMVRWYYCTPGPGTIIRQQALEFEPERDPVFRYVGDYEYWLRLGLHGKFAHIPHSLATWRSHEGATTVVIKGDERAKEYIDILDKLFAHPRMTADILEVKGQAYASAHYLLGHLYLFGGQRLKALRHFTRSIIASPTNCHPNGQPRQWVFMLYMFVIPGPIRKVIFKSRSLSRRIRK